jgi:hypothetical protein
MGVTFERLQFRVATANNGKRRASQQYFRLVFELVAELPDGSQHTISECFSSPLVVRGRSPGHYSNDLQQAKKKRKLVEMPMPTAAVPEEEKESKEKIETSCVVLPPPQYVYASPPMVESNVVSPASTTTSLNSSNPIPYTSVHPGYLNSSFHNRSQSANDTDFFSRSRALRYMVDDHHHQQQHPQQPHHHHQQSEPLYEQFEVARALRNWQQQVIRQRTDSGATFDSYMSNDSQRQDRPNEPYPIQFSGYLHHSSSWTTAPPPTAATAFRTDGKPNYNHPASGSPKMYPNTAPSS